MPKLTKAEKIAYTPIEQMIIGGRDSKPLLESYLRTLRAGYKRRAISIRKSGEYSHANQQLVARIPPNTSRKNPKDMTWNQLILEIAIYQDFFKSKTSSVPGIKAVNREQDKRIFGTGTYSRPSATMSPEERRDYWTLYDEFMNQNDVYNNHLYSEQVQRTLASALIKDEAKVDPVSGHEIKFSQLDLVQRMDYIKSSIEESFAPENLEESTPNVYSGRWRD